MPLPETMCARCDDEDVALFPAACKEDPEALRGQPIGMYHCPDCGSMILAGVKHPELCEKCNALVRAGEA